MAFNRSTSGNTPAGGLQPTLETRIIAVGVILILVVAFLALYVFPTRTDIDFAWTIKPGTTAMIIGAGYLAGGLFFGRVATARRWGLVQAGFLPITSFTIIMMAATFLHWDRFHQGTFVFIVWFAVYAITPFLVPFLWWRNRGRDPKKLEEHDLRFSITTRRVMGALGLLGMGVALAAFIWPSLYISIIPWKLTELTARIFSGWTLLSSATVLSLAVDGRWSATRLLLQSAMFGQALTLLSLPRIWPDLDPAKPMSYVFIGALAAALVVSSLIHVLMDHRSRTPVLATLKKGIF